MRKIALVFEQLLVNYNEAAITLKTDKIRSWVLPENVKEMMKENFDNRSGVGENLVCNYRAIIIFLTITKSIPSNKIVGALLTIVIVIGDTFSTGVDYFNS